MSAITINSEPGAVADPDRFTSLLSSDACSRHLYDQVLFEIDDCVVAPTLGSILPYWLLVVPRASFVNFVEWRAATGRDPAQLVGEVLAEYGIRGDRAFWFEHGPVARGSILACGVDHAHLHVIVDAPFSFSEFTSAAKRAAPLLWKEIPADRAHRSNELDTSYLLAASGDRAYVAKHVECAGSQFFRRIIARLAGQPHAWDYKTHAHLENIKKTVRTFCGQSIRSVAR